MSSSRKVSLFQTFNPIIFQIVHTPFTVDVAAATSELHMELIELQSSKLLEKNYFNISLIDFYGKYLPKKDRFPNLYRQVQRISSFFDNTYLYEAFFSRIKHTKSKSEISSRMNICRQLSGSLRPK